MRKTKILILALCFIMLFTSSVSADTSVTEAKKQANDFMRQEFGYEKDFFLDSIKVKGKTQALKYGKYTFIDNKTGGISLWALLDGFQPRLLTYGSPWSYTSKYNQYRYAGYTVLGHPFTNPLHPFDVWTGGVYEDKPGTKFTIPIHNFGDEKTTDFIVF